MIIFKVEFFIDNCELLALISESLTLRFLNPYENLYSIFLND